jgi:thymidylate synthase (FAD)
MGKLVTPKVYLIGYTVIDTEGMQAYLHATGNGAFWDTMCEARKQGLSDGEILCSFYAKLCYASLTLGHNDNVTRVRDIPENLINCFNSGHGSVFEHASINFVITNCSRVLTHELVRHRVGTAFSQTSGRYVRGNEVDIVFDPILEPVRHYVEMCQKDLENAYKLWFWILRLDEETNFDQKKKLTSALRRILPNGQSNEIGFSINLRALRHIIQLRTSRHAEWEIREIFSQIYRLVSARYPLLFHGAKVGGNRWCS